VVLRHVIQYLKLEFLKILPDRGFDLGVSNSKLFKIVGVYRSDKCICRISICSRWSTSSRRAGVVLLTCSMPWAWRMRTSWICSLHGWGNNFEKCQPTASGITNGATSSQSWGRLWFVILSWNRRRMLQERITSQTTDEHETKSSLSELMKKFP